MKKNLLILAIVLINSVAIFSQVQLVKDINTTTSVQHSSPSKFVTINGITFFTAMTVDYGIELWKTDGTTAGTEMVMDIAPGAGGSNPGNLTNVNGMLYFSASANAKGTELWKSDGTDTGTVIVKDIYTGSLSSMPSSFVVMGSTLLFSANDGINGYELWKSDGTDAGTVLVKDIYPGVISSSPASLTLMNSNIYFSASDGTDGVELWKSDGTTGGTGLVKDIWPGISSSSPAKLMAIGASLFFRAADSTVSGNRGIELWKSNGTTNGTIQIKDINPGSGNAIPDYLTAIGTTLYFSAYNPTYGQELWRCDPPNYNSASTVMVADINPNVGNSSPQYLTNVNGILFFSAYDLTNGTELWLSGGDSTTTGMVKDIYPGITNSSPTLLTSHNNNLYFVANESTGGAELWRSDGTINGTFQVKDIEAGTGSSSPTNFFSYGSLLLFSAITTTSGTELWKSDGTSAGTNLLLNINPEVGSSIPSYMTKINDTLYFGANDGINGTELWKSDGTTAGTLMIKDIYPGIASSFSGPTNVDGIINIAGTLFFAAQDGTNGVELWKSNGTSAGTVMVKDIFPGTNGSAPAHFMNVNGTLFFFANNGTTGNELWKSDGTSGGTVLLKDINPGSSSSNPMYSSGNMVSYNNKLYFQANDGTNGYELWVSDGTTGGTTLVKDIYTGNSGNPYSLTVSNGKLFFYATDPTNGTELWMSDGTTGGTMILKDILAGSSSSSPVALFDMNGTLFFGANDGGGNELWKSDGTSGGTVMVKNIWPGNPTASNGFTKINNTLYFRSKDAATGAELWKTDGTAAGTVLVRDYWAGTGAALPTYLVNFHDTLFYSARNLANGTELCVSAGTPQTTGLAADIYPGGGSSAPMYFVTTTNNLFFMANDGVNGKELWKLSMPPALQSTSNVTNLICNGGETGAIDITVTGGTPPYTYLWSDSSTTQDISGLAAGTYFVSITDSWGWKMVKNFNIAQPAPITVSLTSQTNVSCNGGNNGAITISVVGPASPFSFLWSPGGITTQNISGLSANTYSVVVTNTLGCTKNFSATITQPQTVAANSICMVTVDTLSTHNIIYWEKPVVTNVDSFRIYREVTTNNFAHIASVSYSALSEYHDYAADPNVTSYKYKIAAIDSCGNESTLSDYHNTIHLQNLGSGNLQWTLYGIENASNPVNYYRIYRDDINTGNYLPISLTIPGGNSTYTDVNYNSYPNANYRVDVAWSISCSPTRAIVNTTRSNIKHQGIVSGIADELSFGISIYPNPANESITIELDQQTAAATIKIIDVLGQLMEDEMVLPSTSKIVKQINVSGYAKGIYTVSIENNGRKVFKKLVVN